MAAGGGIDELSSDAHRLPALRTLPSSTYRTPKLAPYLLYVDRTALVDEARIAGDDEQPLHTRQAGDDVLDHAICEIFLLGIAAHVLERQHRDRGLVGERERGAGSQAMVCAAAALRSRTLTRQTRIGSAIS